MIQWARGFSVQAKRGCRDDILRQSVRGAVRRDGVDRRRIGADDASSDQPDTGNPLRLRRIPVGRADDDEKLWLSDAAARLGFKGLADFMRAAALDRAVSN
jgi:hypothetical protein